MYYTHKHTQLVHLKYSLRIQVQCTCTDCLLPSIPLWRPVRSLQNFFTTCHQGGCGRPKFHHPLGASSYFFQTSVGCWHYRSLHLYPLRIHYWNHKFQAMLECLCIDSWAPFGIKVRPQCRLCRVNLHNVNTPYTHLHYSTVQLLLDSWKGLPQKCEKASDRIHFTFCCTFSRMENANLHLASKAMERNSNLQLTLFSRWSCQFVKGGNAKITE